MATQTFASGIFVRLMIGLTIPLLSSCAWQILPRWTDDVEVVENGSFEMGNFVPGTLGPIMALTSNSIDMTSWTVIPIRGQDVAWVRNDNQFVPNATTDGSHFVDLTGTKDQPDSNRQFGSIRQTVQKVKRMIPNAYYELSFQLGVYNKASNPEFGGPIQVRINVSPTTGPNKQSAITCSAPAYPPSDIGPKWSPCSIRFWPTSDEPTFTITGELAGVPGRAYIGIDRVSMQCVAPWGQHEWCGQISSVR